MSGAIFLLGLCAVFGLNWKIASEVCAHATVNVRLQLRTQQDAKCATYRDMWQAALDKKQHTNQKPH